MSTANALHTFDTKPFLSLSNGLEKDILGRRMADLPAKQHLAKTAHSNAHTEAPILSIGERFGPYEIKQHLSSNDMASTYLAWHVGLCRHEMLTVPRRQGRCCPERTYLCRLMAEVRTASRLKHRHIAAIYNVSDADSPLQHFSSEYIDGTDLGKILEERGRLEPCEAIALLSQIASALDYAHREDIVHLDLSPSNVLLRRSCSWSEGTGHRIATWEAKVTGFSLSRASEENGESRLMHNGLVVSAPEYMSPEQAGSGAAVSHRTDIYSLGCLAYEMLCGEPPFLADQRASRLSVLTKHINDLPTPLNRHLPDIPRAASSAVLKALSKRPESRFASCSEFAAALCRALEPSHAPSLAGRTHIDGEMEPETPSTRRLVCDSLREPVDRVLNAVARPRTSTMLSALGGLIVGASLVFGWLGFGP